MAEKAAWDLFAGAVRNGGDIEYLKMADVDVGRTFRFQIRSASRHDQNRRLNVVPLSQRYAYQFPNGTWRRIAAPHFVAFSQASLVGATAGANGQIDFETDEIKGTYYPPGQNLNWFKVK